MSLYIMIGKYDRNLSLYGYSTDSTRENLGSRAKAFNLSTIHKAQI